MKRKTEANIRRLSYSDSSGYISLVTEVYSEIPSSMWYDRAPTENTLMDLFKAKLIESEAGNVIDIVAESKEKKLLGECEITRIDGRRAVVGIITLPEARGTGLSGSMLNAAEQMARKLSIKELIAEVKTENARAVSFFERNGFIKMKEEKGLVTMEKEL